MFRRAFNLICRFLRYPYQELLQDDPKQDSSDLIIIPDTHLAEEALFCPSQLYD